MPNLAERLHYQMLRRVYSGTSEEALEQLIDKTGDGVSVQPGEPISIFYSGGTNTEQGGGAMLAVKSPNGSGKSYVFYNAEQIDERFEEDELVTAEALLDLDDRLSGLSDSVDERFNALSASTKADMSGITITEDVKAIGVTAGAINPNDVVKSGTTLTAFVKQLLQKTIMHGVSPASVTYSTDSSTYKTAGASYSVEVGTAISFNLTPSFTDAYFTGTTAQGFSSDQLKVAANLSPTYTYNGTTASTSNEVNYSATTATTEIYVTAAYTGVTATDAGATNNTGGTDTSSVAAGSKTSGKMKITGYFNYVVGGAEYPTVASASDVNPFDITGTTKDFITSSKVTLYSGGTPYTNASGTNLFIAVPSDYSVKAYDNLSGNEIDKFDTATKSVTLASGYVCDYKIYWYKGTGAQINVKNITITKD